MRACSLRLMALAGVALWAGAAGGVAQEVKSPPLPPATAPAPAPAPATGMSDLMAEIQRLKAEVAATRQLKDEVSQLRNELYNLRSSGLGTSGGMSGGPGSSEGPGAAGEIGGRGRVPSPTGTGALNTRPPEGNGGAPETMTSHTLIDTGTIRDDTLTDFPLRFRYRYNSTAEGPIAGGTYLEISDPSEEFTLKFQNQVSIDSTNFDRQFMPTTEQGWNIPFGRTGIWGNVTRNFAYQVCLQYFLGDINLLDMFGAYQWDKFRIRIGKGLSPVLYEYYAFDPDFEPVITNSMSFQLANKRPIGATFIANTKFWQLWAGITNNLVSGYYDVTRNPQFIGAGTLTPFKDTDGIFKHLGGGVGYSVGYEQYALFGPGSTQANVMEQTTNNNWVTSSGVPFAVYNPNVWSVGERTRIAPHLFWYGRFSFVAEYIVHSRELSDGKVTGRSTQNGLMFMASYYLTGERDFGGNGVQGFSSVEPIRPFLPSRGQWGIGAWQVGAQWSQFDVGRADFNNGFIDAARYTNRANQLMTAINWWPVKNTRLSFDWVWNEFNAPIPFTSGMPLSSFNTFWFRYAMFF